jgi:cytochrome c551/c552
MSARRTVPPGVSLALVATVGSLVTYTLSRYVFFPMHHHHPGDGFEPDAPLPVPAPKPPKPEEQHIRKTQPQGWLGLKVADIRDGVRVTDVYVGGPADQRGISIGDVLLAVNGSRATRDSIFQAVSTSAIGSDITFDRRGPGGKSERIRVPLERSAGTDVLLERLLGAGAEALVAEQFHGGLWPHFDMDAAIAGAPGVATSALACMALAVAGTEGGPTGQAGFARGIEALLAHQAPDGGLDDKGVYLARRAYATSFLVIALSEQKFTPGWHASEVERAREWLCKDQLCEANGYSKDSPGYGGWSDYLMAGRAGADMSLTAWVLDALAASHLPPTRPEWARARTFLERCQNVAVVGTTAETRRREEPLRDGGFSFSPIDSKAGRIHVGDGLVVSLSYGSATADGLRGLVAAGADDGRVQKAAAWLAGRFTLDRVPGFDPRDLVGWSGGLRFYYLASLARGLHEARIDRVAASPTDEGRSWPDDVARWFANHQADVSGGWKNADDVMHEDSPTVATAFGLVALGAARDQMRARPLTGAVTTRGLAPEARPVQVERRAISDVERGRLLFQSGAIGCASCHNDDNTGTGPSLVGVGDRYVAWKGTPRLATEQFTRHIRDPQQFPGQKVQFWPGHMFPYRADMLPEPDLSAIVSFLVSRTGTRPVSLDQGGGGP